MYARFNLWKCVKKLDVWNSMWLLGDWQLLLVSLPSRFHLKYKFLCGCQRDYDANLYRWQANSWHSHRLTRKYALTFVVAVLFAPFYSLLRFLSQRPMISKGGIKTQSDNGVEQYFFEQGSTHFLIFTKSCCNSHWQNSQVTFTV